VNITKLYDVFALYTGHGLTDGPAAGAPPRKVA
jgi:hypothetical protein